MGGREGEEGERKRETARDRARGDEKDSIYYAY